MHDPDRDMLPELRPGQNPVSQFFLLAALVRQAGGTVELDQRDLRFDPEATLTMEYPAGQAKVLVIRLTERPPPPQWAPVRAYGQWYVGRMKDSGLELRRDSVGEPQTFDVEHIAQICADDLNINWTK